jgi:flagellar motor switch protein FliN/FliY
VNTISAVPYDWLKQIPRDTLEKGETPLLLCPGDFPWDKFSAFMSKIFQLEKLVIKPSQWEYRNEDHLLKGIGSPIKTITCDLAPLDGTFSWIISESDLDKLMSLTLTKQFQASDYIDKDFKEGFFQFVVLEVINAFNRVEYDKAMIPHIQKDAKAPNHAALCLDITLVHENVSMSSRLILSEELRHAMRERYSQRMLKTELSPLLAQKLQAIVHLEAGRTSLSSAEWASVKPGDYIILDTCSCDPVEDKCRVTMVLGDKVLFRAKLKQGSLKILEFPLYHEVETTMSKDDDHDFDEDETELEDSEFEEHDESEFHDEDDLSEIEDHEHETVIENSKAPSAAKPSAPAAEAKNVISTAIQLTVVVEVGRLQMSIQKLMELQPGDMLDLDIHPENGVDLVVNGNTIAKGELLKIGETIGVRVLDKV